ncbi:peptidoglycan D,D-transpeptidase FtsI family protein [Heyndrickxia acidicola]|uniref:serine-type D-Ala-D-Ala carboxypeptidase n=1 Tax=Heyndrickxia acidicola TaxID=209389 RepID=A0ABU6MJN4_9BACI|nr:penicillin-binding protein 2 [Heyndrickxia acidicola]MED1204725.1 penicillin-binding protein 2 [Heyndrickxia acidicola]
MSKKGGVFIRRKRYFFISCILLLLFIALEGRLAQIQLINTENFSNHHVNLLKSSVSQRTQEMVIDDGRGQFTDRTGLPLNYSEKPVLVLFPFLKNMKWNEEKVAAILDIQPKNLQDAVKGASKPFVFGGTRPYLLTKRQINQINTLKIPGVFGIREKQMRSDIAGQLIGITGEDADTFIERYPEKKGLQNEKMGITGLQKQFDEFLLPDSESKLVYHVDGLGDPLFGVNVKYKGPANPYYPVKIQTTLDKNLQIQMESLVDRYHIKKGGAVLLDIKNNEVLASVSRPQLNSANPFENGSATNMMTTQQIPGSIFKTVTAAAAIQTGSVENSDSFSCNEDLYGNPDKRKLGTLDFKESFAESCNRTFGDLAKRLKEKNPVLLESFAEKLGLIGEIGWHGPLYHFPDFQQLNMDSGRVFIRGESKKDDNLAAHTGIGQQEVRVTPLGVANMMASIARGGQPYMVRTVSAIKYQDGSTMETFPMKKIKGDSISKITAMKLQQMLRRVVTSSKGTGNMFQTLPFKVAGKSGTAETGIYKGNVQLHNKWFAGYFPFENPQYALVVVNLEVPEATRGINPLFSDIVKMVYEYSHKQANE